MSMPDKVALDYSRVSSMDDESNETQRKVCIEIARSDGYVIPADLRYHYADDHISGAERHRQGLDQLIADVLAGRVGPEGTVVKVDRLYIREPARLWRGLDPRFPQYFEYLMQERGILVRYTNEAEAADYSEGVRGHHVGTYISRTVNQVNAAGERLELREKSRRRRRELVLDGFYPHAAVPYGVERVLVDKRSRDVVRVVPRGESIRLPDCRLHLRPADNEEARTVRLIFESIRSGMSMGGVAQELNRRGVPSANGHGTWVATMIARVLRNPIYCGTLLWGNPYHARGKKGRHKRRKALPPLLHTESEITGQAPILYPNFLQPLIPIDLWQEVQDIISARNTQWDRRRAAKPVYLFSGKIRCTACGALYNGRPRTMGRYRYTYYVHDVGYKSKYRGCPHAMRGVRTEVMEKPVLDRIRELLASGSLDALVREELDRMRGPGRNAEVDRRLREVREEIKKLELKLASATEDSLEATGAHRDVLVARASKLGAQLDAQRGDLNDLEQEERRVAAMRERHLSLLADGPTLVRYLDSMDWQLLRKVIEHAIEVVRYDSAGRLAEVVLRLTPTHTIGG